MSRSLSAAFGSTIPPDDGTVTLQGRAYRPGTLLYQGKESRVYSACRTDGGDGDTAFVLKVYECTPGDDVWETALRDAEAGRRLRGCRHIVPLLADTIRRSASGTSDRCEVFLLMPKLLTFRERWDNLPSPPFHEREVTALYRDIAAALQVIHRRGLVHGDVKPDNLYYDPRKGWLLGDFGSVIRRGEPARTVSEGYCAPEARAGQPCNPATDAYALGVTVYRLVCGDRLPFCDRPCNQMTEDEVYHAIERRLRGEPIPPPTGISPALRRRIGKLLRQSWS
ncbi:MAG: protein kinase [Clostridia bacterium]|nr:protein kinase [Clostridia bacterium]